ncbi:hypothetical protein ABZ702_14075 [Streptomyces cyaneofuscatus]|uniref:hypothetical protein n=1 Tax=Streptomyces cyaneofuscatus TaxID=66883 RepID=UPI0033E31559
MAIFPSGNFTIVNNDTGRCVRVGPQQLQGDYLKPSVVLGPADGTSATAWWFQGSNDMVEREPYNQIVSYLLGKEDNLGNRCVSMYIDHSDKDSELTIGRKRFKRKLNALPADTRPTRAALIPKPWRTQFTKDYQHKRDQWLSDRLNAERDQAWLEAQLEAWAADQDPLSSEKLTRLRAYLEQELASRQREERHSQWEREGKSHLIASDRQEEPQKPEDVSELLTETDQDPRATRVGDQASTLHEAWAERRSKELEQEYKDGFAVAALEQWHELCAFIALPEDIEIKMHTDPDKDKEIKAGLRAYIDAVAQEGVTASPAWSSAQFRTQGCGRGRSSNDTYRWEYDGTHIYAADSKTLPAERTYWTDRDGTLLGRPQGGPGQTWTLASWTPTT